MVRRAEDAESGRRTNAHHSGATVPSRGTRPDSSGLAVLQNAFATGVRNDPVNPIAFDSKTPDTWRRLPVGAL
jgi:hypothetical protein